MKKHCKKDSQKIYFHSFIVLLSLFFITFFISIDFDIFAATKQENNISPEKVIYKNENPIDLNAILEENTEKNVKEELCIEEIDLEYTTKYKQNNELPEGTVQVLQEGRIGKKNVVVIKKYENNELISEELITENILKASVDRIVEVGNGKNKYTYKINEGDLVYVTAISSAIRLLPDENSEKICTLNKDESAKVLKIEGDWLFISTTEIKGYIPKDCVTAKNPETNNNLIDDKAASKGKANLSFGMDLREKSGFSLDEFKKVLSNDKNDKNNVFTNNAEYFYYAEQQYNINGIFVASVAVHESGWGTSSISSSKKNLFGYGAVDSNPYGGAYSFESYGEGIDLLARVFVKYYLNPNGTSIYGGDTANGKYYSGSTLSSIGSKYASDKNWANSVYKWMEYFYGKL